MSARDHVAWLKDLGVPINAVVLNSTPPSASFLAEHGDRGAKPLVDDLETGDGYRVWRAPLWKKPDAKLLKGYDRGGRGRIRSHAVRHDPKGLASLLLRKESQWSGSGWKR